MWKVKNLDILDRRDLPGEQRVECTDPEARVGAVGHSRRQ
jgi:hypothetical protein